MPKYLMMAMSKPVQGREDEFNAWYTEHHIPRVLAMPGVGLYIPAYSGDTVYVPCSDGLRAVRVESAGTPSLRWRAQVSAAGSPAVGGGAVWVLDYYAGILFALDPAAGTVRQQVGIGTAPHFASPTLAGNRAYVGTMSGVVAVDGA